jgi:hypothetical protein
LTATLCCAALRCAVLCCLQSISDCTLNPLTRDHLASPVAITNLKTMGLKMVMVVVSTGLAVLGRTQVIVMLLCAAIITYFLLRTVRKGTRDGDDRGA